MTTALTLYAAADELAHLLDKIDPETGEIPEEVAEALAQFEGKGKAVAAYILNQEATADAIDTTIKTLERKAESLRTRADSMRTYLRENMRRAGMTSITADDGTFSAKLYIERDESVEIMHRDQIPMDCMRQPKPQEPQPDKSLILKKLKAGIDVPGARIQRNDRLTIK